jgi:hypothetical protein
MEEVCAGPGLAKREAVEEGERERDRFNDECCVAKNVNDETPQQIDAELTRCL